MNDDDTVNIPLDEIENLGSIPELEPKIDEVFVDLMQKALKGQLNTYYAEVPLSLIIPYDIEHKPDSHPIGKQVIEEITNDFKKGKNRSVMLYPKGKWFILSDHYLEMFAAIDCNLLTLNCVIFGEFKNENVKIVKGPLSVDEIRKVFRLT